MLEQAVASAFGKFLQSFSGEGNGNKGTQFKYGQGALSTSPTIKPKSMIEFINGSQPRPPQYGLLNNRIANNRKKEFGLLSNRLRGLLS
tara:strand:+ start:266 stop:532 length:267 start_codon:yes stop_codon:yes gene_type:complete